MSTPAADGIERKQCPDCAEFVLAEARVCRHCRYRFAPLPEGISEPTHLREVGPLAPTTPAARAAAQPRPPAPPDRAGEAPRDPAEIFDPAFERLRAAAEFLEAFDERASA